MTNPRYVWESKAVGAFAISEDEWNEPLGRGTEIRLHLKDEAQEYLDEHKLKVRKLYRIVSMLFSSITLHPLNYQRLSCLKIVSSTSSYLL